MVLLADKRTGRLCSPSLQVLQAHLCRLLLSNQIMKTGSQEWHEAPRCPFKQSRCSSLQLLQVQRPTWHWIKSSKRHSSTCTLQAELFMNLTLQAMEKDLASQHMYASDLGRNWPQ